MSFIGWANAPYRRWVEPRSKLGFQALGFRV